MYIILSVPTQVCGSSMLMAEGGSAAPAGHAAPQPAPAQPAPEAEPPAAALPQAPPRSVSCTLPLDAGGDEADSQPATEPASMACAATQIAEQPAAVTVKLGTAAGDTAAAGGVAAEGTAALGTLAVGSAAMTAAMQTEVASGGVPYLATQQLQQDTAGDGASSQAGATSTAAVPVGSAAAEGSPASTGLPGSTAAMGGGASAAQLAWQPAAEMLSGQPSQAAMALTAAEPPARATHLPAAASEAAEALGAAAAQQPSAGQRQPNADPAVSRGAERPATTPQQQLPAPAADTAATAQSPEHAAQPPVLASQAPAALSAVDAASPPAQLPPAAAAATEHAPPRPALAETDCRTGAPAAQQRPLQEPAISFEGHQPDSFDAMMQPSQAPMLLTSEGGSDVQPATGGPASAAGGAQAAPGGDHSAAQPAQQQLPPAAQPASIDQQAPVAVTPATAAPAGEPSVAATAAATPATPAGAARPAQPPSGGSEEPADAGVSPGFSVSRTQALRHGNAGQIVRSLLFSGAGTEVRILGTPPASAATAAATAGTEAASGSCGSPQTAAGRRASAITTLAAKFLQQADEVAGLHYHDCLTAHEVVSRLCEEDSQVGFSIGFWRCIDLLRVKKPS